MYQTDIEYTRMCWDHDFSSFQAKSSTSLIKKFETTPSYTSFLTHYAEQKIPVKQNLEGSSSF